VRRADFCRAEQARRRRLAHVPKLSEHGLKTEADVTGDVLNEDPLGGALLHKSPDFRTSPIPGQTYPTTTVTGMPRAVKPFRTATLTWSSAT